MELALHWSKENDFNLEKNLRVKERNRKEDTLPYV